MRKVIGLIVLGVGLVVGDCSKDLTGPVVATLTISPDTVRLQHGAVQLLSVAALDANGRAITGVAVTFTSADTGVATVSTGGLVTARKAGATAITASSGAAHQNATVFVFTAAMQVSGTPADTIIHLGGAYGLTVTALDSAGRGIPGPPLSFTSLDTTVARVSPTGAVSGVGIGSTHITLLSGPATGFVAVRVIDTTATSRYIVSAPTDTLLVQGKSYQLRTVVSDSVHAPIPNAIVHYASDNSSVATVTSGGLVTAVALGTAVITAQSESVFVLDTVKVADSSIVASPAVPGSPFGIAATQAGVVYVARHSDNAATRFNLPGTTPAASIPLDPNPAYVAFDSAGTTAYVTSIDGHVVQVIAVATNVAVDTIPTSGAPIVVKVSPDDQSIFVTTDLDTLYEISRTTKAITAAFPVPGVGNGIAFNPANDSLGYVGTQGDTVVEFNYKRGTVGRKVVLGGKTQGVVVSADGTTLYVANELTNRIDAVTLATGVSAGFVNTSNGGAFDLQLSPDGTKLWASLPGAGAVDEYDRASLTLLRTVRTTGTPRRIAVTPASTLVLVANESGWVDFIK